MSVRRAGLLDDGEKEKDKASGPALTIERARAALERTAGLALRAGRRNAMTAPAAALVSGAIAAPALARAPQAVTDRFAFAAMLDSLPGATAKAGSAVAEERSQTSNAPKQEQSPSGPSDSHPMLGDGAFLSSLPFALPSGLAAGQGTAAGVDASPLASAATKGARLETSGASDAATVEPGETAPSPD